MCIHVQGLPVPRPFASGFISASHPFVSTRPSLAGGVTGTSTSRSLVFMCDVCDHVSGSFVCPVQLNLPTPLNPSPRGEAKSQPASVGDGVSIDIGKMEMLGHCQCRHPVGNLTSCLEVHSDCTLHSALCTGTGKTGLANAIRPRVDKGGGYHIIYTSE